MKVLLEEMRPLWWRFKRANANSFKRLVWPLRVYMIIIMGVLSLVPVSPWIFAGMELGKRSTASGHETLPTGVLLGFMVAAATFGALIKYPTLRFTVADRDVLVPSPVTPRAIFLFRQFETWLGFLFATALLAPFIIALAINPADSPRLVAPSPATVIGLVFAIALVLVAASSVGTLFHLVDIVKSRHRRFATLICLLTAICAATMLSVQHFGTIPSGLIELLPPGRIVLTIGFACESGRWLEAVMWIVAMFGCIVGCTRLALPKVDLLIEPDILRLDRTSTRCLQDLGRDGVQPQVLQTDLGARTPACLADRRWQGRYAICWLSFVLLRSWRSLISPTLISSFFIGIIALMQCLVPAVPDADTLRLVAGAIIVTAGGSFAGLGVVTCSDISQPLKAELVWPLPFDRATWAACWVAPRALLLAPYGLVCAAAAFMFPCSRPFAPALVPTLMLLPGVTGLLTWLHCSVGIDTNIKRGCAVAAFCLLFVATGVFVFNAATESSPHLGAILWLGALSLPLFGWGALKLISWLDR